MDVRHKSYLMSLFFILSISLLSCKTNTNEGQETTSIPLSNVSDIMEVDRAFSKLSLEQGMNKAFESYVADDGVLLKPNNYPIVGKDKIVERLYSNSDSTFRLTWEPITGKIAGSGELGYTYGIWLVSSIEGDSLGQGTYVSVWQKNNQNEWKFVLDSGNDGLE